MCAAPRVCLLYQWALTFLIQKLFLQSDTCSLNIPQLDLEVGPHALGGRFTTVEGLLVAVKEQLSDPRYSHMFGDSLDPERKNHLRKFMERFEKVLEGRVKVTLILDDPAGNSYIQVSNLW